MLFGNDVGGSLFRSHRREIRSLVRPFALGPGHVFAEQDTTLDLAAKERGGDHEVCTERTVISKTVSVARIELASDSDGSFGRMTVELVLDEH